MTRDTVMRYDLSGVGLAVTGLDQALASALDRDWRAFAGGEGPAFLDVQVETVPGATPDAEFRPKAMQAQIRSGGADFSMPEGRARVDAAGVARIRLLADTGERRYYTLLNLMRACLAWRLPDRGGALLHAAGLVLARGAHLLVGAEGSGKTTWAGLGQRAGARVLSDDLILLDGIRGRPEALGAPFRSTLRMTPEPGRWPLRSISFPVHGSPSRWRPAAALLARARLLANLPFVAQGIADDPRLQRLLDSLLARVPCGELTYGLDPSFVEVLSRSSGDARD